MKNLSIILFATLGLLAFGAFVGWRVHVAAHTLTPVEGLVFDPSASHMGSKDHACDEVANLTAALLSQSTPGTKLTIMEIGNSRTAGEPILLTTSDAVPERHNLASGMGKLKKERAAYLQSIRQACIATPTPEYSPIYSAVGRMLEHIHTYKCGTAAACTVWVSTDGLENVLVPLRDQIRGVSQRRQYVPKLANDDIEVHFCGLAEGLATESRDLDSRRAFHIKPDPLRVESVWRSVFTKPERVTFAPFCPQPPGTF